ncbi:MAG TPA: LysR family transcriptional regulator [Zoogloea sp.]|uniref:LysR family transcriptional regulator n=1 Tax=Zoogloea sp. TaxID=49181 RepID=UPI001B49D839|nr:LysR family transcriptional regulator [Zoogloea sp.]MBP8265361.1 LysR family transcriptional regulator [Zoogloea sp.]HOB46458.1 LysR family transcriptional regulator [Zoogloea sp.]HQA11834.1 LysR family transcriptional regulator [Zoogloea sp.]HQE39104.1 LysR family transcriptional regulator [Zoogloea sp.]
MNLFEAMHQFVRVVELGSFAAVANQLGVARSVVTRQIAGLEEHLGVKLLVRSTRSLTLTSAGGAYLEKCRLILDLVESAAAGVMEERQAPRGNLRVSLPLSFGLKRLAPLMLDFSRIYPEINLAMDFTDRKMNLIEEGIDLSVRITSRLEPGDIVRKLGTCRLMTVASPDYLARHGRPQHPSELSGHACIGYSPQANNRPWVFLVDGRQENVHLSFRLQANNGDALVEAAAQGLGITVQPDFIACDYVAAGKLEMLLEEFAPPELGIYAVLPSNRYLPHGVRVLIDFLSEKLGPAAAAT